MVALIMMVNKTHEGRWVRLKGISGHGKNRIREHGDVWLVQMVWTNKIMLRSKDLTFKSGKDMIFDGRWVNIPTDKNFEIIGVDV